MENLKPLSERTKDEQRAIQSLGGVASGKTRRKKRDLRRIAESLIGWKYNGEIKSNIEVDGDKGEITILEAVVISLCQQALSGDISATRLLFELVSGKYDKISNLINGTNEKQLIRIYLPDNERGKDE